jgi:hypothetical protein
MRELTVGKWIEGAVSLGPVRRVRGNDERLRVRSVVALLDAAACLMKHDSGTGCLNVFSESVCDERAAILLSLRTGGGLAGLPACDLTASQKAAGLWLVMGELDWPLWGAGSDLEALHGLGLGGVVSDLSAWLQACGVSMLPEWSERLAGVRQAAAEVDYFAC